MSEEPADRPDEPRATAGVGARPYVIAVDGRSGVGKTDLAAVLADCLGGRAGPVPVVHVDQLLTGWKGLDEGIDRLVDGVLAPLAEGRSGWLRRWDWEHDADGDVVELPWAPVVVVEGVGAGAARCAPYLSCLLWLELDDAERYRRAMARDGELFRPWWDVWAAQEDDYLAADRPWERADVLVRA